MTAFTIDRRFNGPPDSGNGGWTAGTVASFVGGPAVVTLHRPPPLATPLTTTIKDSITSVYASEALVATAQPASVEPEPIDAVPFDEAVAISASYPGFASHPFPTCFVCGPEREPGDGMRLFTGRVSDGLTATPWIVPADVTESMTWASLDCPGGWSVGLESRPYVLGRIAAHIAATPAPGAHCVVMGRLLSSVGRKAQVATVLYGPEGDRLAWSSATWIAIA